MKAIILFSYGTLNSIDDVGPFLKHVMHSHATDDIIEQGKKQFLTIGKSDPLTASLKRIGQRIEDTLNKNTDDEWKYYIGNKHTTPFVKDAIESCVKDGAQQIITVPTTPFYSKTGTLVYERQVVKSLEKLNADIPVINLRDYYKYDKFVDILAERMEEAYQWLSESDKKHAEVIFTCHSMPGSEESNQDFINQYQSLVNSIMEKVSFKAPTSISYRSAGHDKENWLQPDVLEVMEERIKSGASAIVVSELLSIIANMEVLTEVGQDGMKLAQEHQVPFIQTEYINDHFQFIDFLIELIEKQTEKY